MNLTKRNETSFLFVRLQVKKKMIFITVLPIMTLKLILKTVLSIPTIIFNRRGIIRQQLIQQCMKQTLKNQNQDLNLLLQSFIIVHPTATHASFQISRQIMIQSKLLIMHYQHHATTTYLYHPLQIFLLQQPIPTFPSLRNTKRIQQFFNVYLQQRHCIQFINSFFRHENITSATMLLEYRWMGGGQHINLQ